jgi:subtilisin family serine protease
MPPAALPALSELSGVRLVRRPIAHVALAVDGEEVAASLASTWLAKGITGKGVKVGIIDLGFRGLADRQASGDLPADVTTADFCAGQLATGEEHGTAVAEIVHEMAPDAQLYLICFDSDVTLAAAEAYAKSQGIRIANYSVGAYNDGRGDGTGVDGGIVADARANGILWVAAAGNDAQTHWSGTYADANGNGGHDWTATDEGNTIYVGNDEQICGFLRWDEWPAARSDFDLLLFDSVTGAKIAISDGDQTGSQPPVEGLCVKNVSGSTQRVAWEILGYRVVSAPRLDLFTVGPALEYSTAAGSILEPAAAATAFAVGALCWSTNTLELYSSQGPTIDGRTKPDISGHDSVSGATYGPFSGSCPSGFAGTSAAAPEVAGAAALVEQANPTFGPNELQAFLERSALDLAPAGKDSQTGAGQLRLPGKASAADTTPPVAKALSSSGRRGHIVKLLSRASDDGGQVRVREQVLRGLRVIATVQSRFAPARTPTSFALSWNAPPKAAGALQHCVTAIDKAGNSSPRSCAALVLH